MIKGRVLVTGGAGYVGARLVPQLLDSGYAVRVLDTFWYGQEAFPEAVKGPKLELIEGDIRDSTVVRESVRGVTHVIHLACISNDPSYDLDPVLGEEINFRAFEPLVRISKEAGVQRFVYASSSSVYGVKDEPEVTEDLSLQPLTDYSRFKALCEPIALQAASKDFVVTVLRPATVCGYSPRQRLDLSVNILTNHAVNRGRIKVFGGEQFRPNLHISDMCAAYLSLLTQPASLINGQVFNVGGDNMSISSIAGLVAQQVEGPVQIDVEPSVDHRSYRISSRKIAEAIGFRPSYSVADAVIELRDAFAQGLLPDSFSDSKYFNIDRMQQLMSAGRT